MIHPSEWEQRLDGPYCARQSGNRKRLGSGIADGERVSFFARPPPCVESIIRHDDIEHVRFSRQLPPSEVARRGEQKTSRTRSSRRESKACFIHNSSRWD